MRALFLVALLAAPAYAKRPPPPAPAPMVEDVVDAETSLHAALAPNGDEVRLTTVIGGKSAGAVLQVTDSGPGLSDPYASLRRPDLPVQGAGLWVAHVESDQLHLASAPGSTTVTARFDR